MLPGCGNWPRSETRRISPVGASLLAIAEYQSTRVVPDMALSRAGSLLQLICVKHNLWDIKKPVHLSAQSIPKLPRRHPRPALERTTEAAGVGKPEQITDLAQRTLRVAQVQQGEVFAAFVEQRVEPVSYTHLTLPTNREV